MWFENATNKKMIESMFCNNLSIESLEIISILFKKDDVVINFVSKNIPTKTPSKWQSLNINKINAISLTLEFGSIVNLELRGNKLNFQCSPLIAGTHLGTSIEILNGDFLFFCEAKFLTIRGITPYEDDRW